MKILYLDIETAPTFQHFKDLPEDGQAAFKKKMSFRIGVQENQFINVEAAYAEAALYAEFSRIVCISVGLIEKDTLRVKGIVGTEADILSFLHSTLVTYDPDTLCAHNGKSFDYPFLVRRYLINKIPVPTILQSEGKKPWEINLLDTVEMWRFTDLKYYVSLITLAYVFGIPTPKNGMDGAMVPQAFFDGKIEEIKDYCNRDLVTLVNIHRSIRQLTLIEKIVFT